MLRLGAVKGAIRLVGEVLALGEVLVGTPAFGLSGIFNAAGAFPLAVETLLFVSVLAVTYFYRLGRGTFSTFSTEVDVGVFVGAILAAAAALVGLFSPAFGFAVAF